MKIWFILPLILWASLGIGCGDGDDDAELTPSVAELEQIAMQVFPETAPGSSIYAACGPSTQFEPCPLTERLKDRLNEVKISLCRCQNASDTRVIAVRPEPGGGFAEVTMFRGSYVLRLIVVEEDGTFLVDDETCGGDPATSIYTDPVGPCATR